MDKQVASAVVRGDEPKALLVVEPLDGSRWHEELVLLGLILLPRRTSEIPRGLQMNVPPTWLPAAQRWGPYHGRREKCDRFVIDAGGRGTAVVAADGACFPHAGSDAIGPGRGASALGRIDSDLALLRPRGPARERHRLQGGGDPGYPLLVFDRGAEAAADGSPGAARGGRGAGCPQPVAKPRAGSGTVAPAAGHRPAAQTPAHRHPPHPRLGATPAGRQAPALRAQAGATAPRH